MSRSYRRVDWVSIVAYSLVGMILGGFAGAASIHLTYPSISLGFAAIGPALIGAGLGSLLGPYILMPPLWLLFLVKPELPAQSRRSQTYTTTLLISGGLILFATLLWGFLHSR